MEYQYYEFLAIDRPLSADDIDYVRTLSRRVEPTSTSVVFNYSYGDFSGDPLKLLAKHYDVMLYLANWGSKQLAFRFPRTAVDQAALQPYYYGVEEIELTTVGEYVILNIGFHENEGGEWIEGEGQLAALAPLRDDIMRGDLRALYLAWLAAAERGTASPSDGDEEWDNGEEWGEERDALDADEVIEPPLPPGLGQLTGPLRAFVELFEVDQNLISAAAQTSPALRETSEPLERWVTLLPEAERNRFLLRAARGEPIKAELLRRLREVGGHTSPAAATTPRRSFSAIVAAAKKMGRGT